MSAPDDRLSRARAAPLRFPLAVDARALARLVPSARSVIAGCALVVAAAGVYAAARATSVFAVRTVEVRGAPPLVEREVRDAVRPLVGTSLLALPSGRVEHLVESLPTVAAASHDRAFPNTLVVFVAAERPLAVLRRGAESWLLSSRGRVMRTLAPRARPPLPRIWVARDVSVTLGGTIADTQVTRAARALRAAEAAPALAGVRTVRATPRELTLLFRSGLAVRLGNESALGLKVAVAAEILSRGRSGLEYLDVNVPSRPVARTLNSQVQPETCAAPSC